jgi:hypothetical protein
MGRVISLAGRRARGKNLRFLLIPRLQQLLDDAWTLEEDQRAGGSGDPATDAQLSALASSLCEVAAWLTKELGHRAFEWRDSDL